MNEQIICQILEEADIEYKTKGKNVGENTVNVCCPFCGDTNYHLGIFKDGGNFNCWVCQKTGNLQYLVYVITGDRITIPESNQYLPEGATEDLGDYVKKILKPKVKVISKSRTTTLPEGFQYITELTNNNRVLNYLEGRGVDRIFAQKMGIGYTDHLVKKNRFLIVFPITENKKVVGWVGRDYTGMTTKRHVIPGEFDIHDYLYNFDNIPVNGKVIVCEGPFDALTLIRKNLGYTPVAVLTSGLGKQQINKLIEKKPHTVITCLDSEMTFKNIAYAEYLTCFVPWVGWVGLPKGEDPDSFKGNILEQVHWIKTS